MLTVGAGSAGESAGGSAASRCVVLHTGHALPGAAELEATEVVRRALRRDRAGGALAGGRDVVGAAALLTVQLAVGVAVRNARRRQPALGTSVLLRRIALPILRVRREPALIPNDSSVRLSQAQSGTAEGASAAASLTGRARSSRQRSLHDRSCRSVSWTGTGWSPARVESSLVGRARRRFGGMGVGLTVQSMRGLSRSGSECM